MRMIKSFSDEVAEILFHDGSEKAQKALRRAGWVNVAKVAARKLDMINASAGLDDLRMPRKNRLEALKGERKGQHSIRINDQWRICFKWKDGNAYKVEITDYH